MSAWAPLALTSLTAALLALPVTPALYELWKRADAAPWTHATMEFGAAICTPRAPSCGDCPIAEGCPSRGMAATVPVPRQATFAGSDRAHRGALLRALARARTHSLSVTAGQGILPASAFDRVVEGLERDGLLHRSGGRLRLGGGPKPAATIGP